MSAAKPGAGAHSPLLCPYWEFQKTQAEGGRQETTPSLQFHVLYAKCKYPGFIWVFLRGYLIYCKSLDTKTGWWKGTTEGSWGVEWEREAGLTLKQDKGFCTEDRAEMKKAARWPGPGHQQEGEQLGKGGWGWGQAPWAFGNQGGVRPGWK